MHDASSITTARLVSSAPTKADLDDLHHLHADPRVWEHAPSLRHVDLTQTRALLARIHAGWTRDGLASWVARRSAEPARERGGLVGIGGCSVRGDLVWNLGYRLAPHAWGHGYAQEIIAAARDAARRIQPGRAVTASLLEHNIASQRAAVRAGLHEVWRGLDVGNPDPEAIRLLYADRPLDAATLAGLISSR